MNDDAPRPQGLIPQKRKRKSTTSRGPRTVDPDVLAIRAEATRKVKELHKSRASAKLLKTILDKRLAQLMDNDKMKLFDALKDIVTPSLPTLEAWRQEEKELAK